MYSEGSDGCFESSFLSVADTTFIGTIVQPAVFQIQRSQPLRFYVDIRVEDVQLSVNFG